MADTAVRLAGPLALTTSAVTRYTVPVGTTAIVRSINVVNTNNTTASNFTLSIGTDAAAARIFSAYPIAGGSVLSWSGFLVLNAGDVLQAYGSVATLTLTISGVEVTP